MTVKYNDRCRSPHAGSSTCPGCDPSCWADDDPYNKQDADHERIVAAFDKYLEEAKIDHKYSNNNDEYGDAFGIFKAGISHGKKNVKI